MNLEKHISSLLYHHDCLVVPEFGAFIAQKSNSIYHKETTSFLPPQKQLAFNPSIVKSDGILIQNISQIEGLTFDEAKEKVENCVQLWKNQLDSKGNLDLENLGILTKTEQGSIDFIPKHPNFLLDSFGLESIKAEFILPEISTSDQTGSSAVWWKVAAVVPILLGGFLYFGKPQPVTDYVNQQWSGFVSPELNSNLKATKIIESPVKTIKENAESFKIEIEEESAIHDHQVIVGSFIKKAEADKLVEILNEKGYDKAQFTQKKGRYHYIALQTFKTKDEANEYRRQIAKEFPEAWILSLKD